MTSYSILELDDQVKFRSAAEAKSLDISSDAIGVVYGVLPDNEYRVNFGDKLVRLHRRKLHKVLEHIKPSSPLKVGRRQKKDFHKTDKTYTVDLRVIPPTITRYPDGTFSLLDVFDIVRPQHSQSSSHWYVMRRRMAEMETEEYDNLLEQVRSQPTPNGQGVPSASWDVVQTLCIMSGQKGEDWIAELSQMVYTPNPVEDALRAEIEQLENKIKQINARWMDTLRWSKELAEILKAHKISFPTHPDANYEAIRVAIERRNRIQKASEQREPLQS